MRVTWQGWVGANILNGWHGESDMAGKRGEHSPGLVIQSPGLAADTALIPLEEEKAPDGSWDISPPVGGRR